jgi:shikimate kinase / 3-dehydroquinate synthase
MPAPLFLIGFMAAGKSTVGRAIAQRGNRRFVDLDDLLDTSLAGSNEAEFRRREQAALHQLIKTASDGPVIATGGGAAAYDDNLARMRAAGCVVALGVDVEVARARAAGGPDRPLLANASTLAAKRAPVYRRAHAVVDTTDRALDDVIEQVAAVERAWHRLPFGLRDSTILGLGERSYPVAVYDRALDVDLVKRYLDGATKIVAITDDQVARHWQLPFDTITIPHGEANKTLATYERICSELIARGLDRGSALVALGGGVVGDITGFVAATLYRGIPVIQLPTTIVAMTDAAIGGKTAVDMPAGKNLVGAFWQPRLVACGLETLTTLPERERRAGYGELWKYALLDGPELWQLVSDSLDGKSLHEVIARSIAYKAAIVGRDERELTGHRALLNLGHTVGHAIETASGLHHGEAVGLGLIAACRVSAALVGADAGLETEVTTALRRTGLPAELDPYLTDDILDRIKVDKKRIGDKVRFIAIREVGMCEPVEIAVTELRRILRRESAA